MKVSIVTISLNQGQFIEQALQSIVEQRENGVKVEYIVVDAGSTDSSVEILDRRREDIDVLIREPDGGPADGLNKGFKIASGDILGFLNADDFLEPGALRRVVNYFDTHPTSDAVVGRLRRIDIDGNMQRSRVIVPSPFTAKRYAQQRAAILQPSTFFRDSAWAKTDGFRNDNRTCWDAELFAEMAVNGVHFGRIQSILATFRVHKESITGSGLFEEQTLRDSEIVRQRLGLDADSTPSLNRAVRTFMWKTRPVTRVRNAAATAADRAFSGGQLGEGTTDSR